jgi:hypothetical protein
MQLAPVFTNSMNAAAILYYSFVLLPLAAAGVGLSRWWGAEGLGEERQYLLPVIALAIVVSIGLLTRGATAVRLPDVAASHGILGGWMIGLWANRLFERRRDHAGVRWRSMASGGAIVAALGVVLWSTLVLGEFGARVDRADFDSGVRALWTRTRQVASILARPPLQAVADLDHPSTLRLAHYVNTCTAPSDRVFVFGNHTEVYFFSGRPFAGGHELLLPGFYTDADDQQQTVGWLERARVPVVIVESSDEYDRSYRTDFPLVTKYLDEHFRDAGSFGTTGLRVLVNSALSADRSYDLADGERFPCFAGAAGT